MNETICKLSIGATPLEVRAALSDVRDRMEARRFGEDGLGSLEIVLAEALNNIVEHAYPDGAQGQIDLCLCEETAGIQCAITDNGRPMPGGRLPPGNAPVLMADLMALPEGGFGWFLISELAEDLKYSRRGSQNCLSFRMKLYDANIPKQTN